MDFHPNRIGRLPHTCEWRLTMQLSSIFAPSPFNATNRPPTKSCIWIVPTYLWNSQLQCSHQMAPHLNTRRDPCIECETLESVVHDMQFLQFEVPLHALFTEPRQVEPSYHPHNLKGGLPTCVNKPKSKFSVADPGGGGGLKTWPPDTAAYISCVLPPLKFLDPLLSLCQFSILRDLGRVI